jgi:RNA polymerase sigma factor (sigma-70 family)
MKDNSRTERPRPPLTGVFGGWKGQSDGPHKPTSPGRPGAMSGEDDFLAALPVIDDVVRHVCRRHRLNATEAEDFRSDVRLHFIERNYEVLRQFEGRCAQKTYMNVVVQRLYFDFRNREWSRWRPSMAARRLGPDAIVIEKLVVRDGWLLDQALEMARVNHGIEVGSELREFCNTLAARAPKRRQVPEDDAVDIANPGPWADDRVVSAERDFLAKRVLGALERARQALPPIERLILKMLFEDRTAISDIARALHLEQRPLYRTVERLLKTVGDSMKAEGISPEDVAELLDAPAIEWEKDPDTGALPPAEMARREERKGASWLPKR